MTRRILAAQNPAPTSKYLPHHIVTGDCPKGCAQNRRGGRAEVIDCSHAVGVCCSTCGAYWVPDAVPQEMLETAAPWELGGGFNNMRPGVTPYRG